MFEFNSSLLPAVVMPLQIVARLFHQAVVSSASRVYSTLKVLNCSLNAINQDHKAKIERKKLEKQMNTSQANICRKFGKKL